MTTRLAVLAFLGGLLAVLAPASHAQPDKVEPKGFQPPPVTRKHYPLRHADPAATAKLLEAHLTRGGAATPTGHGVLVTSPGKGDEIAQLLAEIDQPQRQVVVEVTLAELASKDRLPELAGDRLLVRLDELGQAGEATLKRITLTAVEGQPVSTAAEGDRPIVEGGAGPKGARAVNYRKLGTTAKMTARVGPGGAVTVDLNVVHAAVRPPAEDGGFSSVEVVTLTSRVAVPPGKAVLAQSVRSEDKASRAITLMVVTAKVADGHK
jgi:hypothetical protein